MVQRNTPFFRGFASNVSEDMVFDTELIKEDLKNHFFTRKGERVMFPEFGSIIWDLLFEPMTDGIVEEIREDVKRIIDTDPRVAIENLIIREEDHGYTVDIELFFREINKSEQLLITFNREVTAEQLNSGDEF